MLKFDKPFIIAEIGGNHEGNIDYAKKLLIDAAKSGADAVKFQTYFPEKIVSKVEDPNRYEHFSKFSLPIENYFELAKLAKQHGVMFMSSIWDHDSLNELNPLIDIHKVGSGDITNYPLIKSLLLTGKPLIISVAMAKMSEIKEVVEYISSVDPTYLSDNKLAILQCVAMYGDPKDCFANLNVIKSLKSEFQNVTIGYSDHTVGNFAANIAVALGAEIIEIHFTDDKSRDFRDHHISINAKELADLQENISRTITLLGSSKKYPVNEIETSERIREFRRGCYLKNDLKKGDIISSENLTTLRPCKGIDARDFEKIIGSKLLKDKKAFVSLSWSDFE
jgi:N,N'-diacetyllegionaminate synthase